MMTTSAPRSRPRAIASKATAPGSEPSGPLTTSTPARSPQRSSCSTAAARNVSAAPITTLRPSVLRRCQASLPIVVVLPVPLTPTTRITVGSGRRSILSSPVRASSASSSARRLVSASPPTSVALLGLALELLDDLGGRARADVGVDQRLLEALPGLLVEVALEQRRLDLGGERLARLAHVLAQAAEEAAAALLALGLVGRRGGGVVIEGRGRTSRGP